MAHHPQDDAFHEIQLNGKQLVFLFMAATVVSVVIFLCGVLVGRGVRAERAATFADAALGGTPDAPALQPAPPPPAGSDPTKAAPPPAVEDLSYYSRLDRTSPPVEELKPVQEKTAPAPPAKAAPAAAKQAAAEAGATLPPGPPAPSAPKERSAAPPAIAAEPAGPGYAVQIAALNVRSEADAIAKRLASKGYAAYVLAPANGTPKVFRVRIGKFGTKREADTVAAKLQKEEQFKPWVTR